MNSTLKHLGAAVFCGVLVLVSLVCLFVSFDPPVQSADVGTGFANTPSRVNFFPASPTDSFGALPNTAAATNLVYGFSTNTGLATNVVLMDGTYGCTVGANIAATNTKVGNLYLAVAFSPDGYAWSTPFQIYLGTTNVITNSINPGATAYWSNIAASYVYGMKVCRLIALTNDSTNLLGGMLTNKIWVSYR